MQLNDRFIKMIPNLEPVEFIGVAKVLGVPLFDDDKNIRDFIDVFSDVVRAFDKKNRKFKKELIKIMTAGGKNANNSKYT